MKLANEGFGIEKEIAYPIGITFALLHFVGYMFLEHRRQKQASEMIPISTDKVSGKAKDKAKEKAK